MPIDSRIVESRIPIFCRTGWHAEMGHARREAREGLSPAKAHRVNRRSNLALTHF
jgi:hypothetical protein